MKGDFELFSLTRIADGRIQGALSDPHASSTPVIPIPGIKQPYIGYGVGGFLQVAVKTADKKQPELVFTHYNSRDRTRYRQVRTPQ